MRAFAILLLPFALATAQRLTWYEKSLLRDAAQAISGTVVDQAGKPIAQAHIDHSGLDPLEQLFTDDHGRFRIHTRAPAIVVRKFGYNGKLLRLNSAAPLRVVLDRATQSLPACAADCRKLNTPHSAFCLPAIPGIRISEQGRYEETFVRSFLFDATELLHGAGASWSLGIPYTGDVWESSEYRERAFVSGGSEVIDARGVSPDGKRWRYVGRYGESASYYEAAANAAAQLDRVLDGACLKP